MLGSVSVNHSLTGPSCKNGGMFGGNTVPIHLKVMLTPRLGRLRVGKLSDTKLL